jgi:hypothetical protein
MSNSAIRFGPVRLPVAGKVVAGVWENLSSVLEGSIVRLEPLTPRHERGLSEAARNPEIWHSSPYGAAGGSYIPAGTRESFHACFEGALSLPEAGTRTTFASLDARTGEPTGPSIEDSKSAGPGSPHPGGGPARTWRPSGEDRRSSVVEVSPLF